MFMTTLFPDCSSRGPTVARVIDKPVRGEVTFAQIDSFPFYGANSTLAVCNTKKVPGLSINYRSEADYVGEDRMKLFIIFADGSGGEWNFTLIVK